MELLSRVLASSGARAGSGWTVFSTAWTVLTAGDSSLGRDRGATPDVPGEPEGYFDGAPFGQ